MDNQDPNLETQEHHQGFSMPRFYNENLNDDRGSNSLSRNIGLPSPMPGMRPGGMMGMDAERAHMSNMISGSNMGNMGGSMIGGPGSANSLSSSRGNVSMGGGMGQNLSGSMGNSMSGGMGQNLSGSMGNSMNSGMSNIGGMSSSMSGIGSMSNSLGNIGTMSHPGMGQNMSGSMGNNSPNNMSPNIGGHSGMGSMGSPNMGNVPLRNGSMGSAPMSGMGNSMSSSLGMSQMPQGMPGMRNVNLINKQNSGIMMSNPDQSEKNVSDFMSMGMSSQSMMSGRPVPQHSKDTNLSIPSQMMSHAYPNQRSHPEKSQPKQDMYPQYSTQYTQLSRPIEKDQNLSSGGPVRISSAYGSYPFNEYNYTSSASGYGNGYSSHPTSKVERITKREYPDNDEDDDDDDDEIDFSDDENEYVMQDSSGDWRPTGNEDPDMDMEIDEKIRRSSRPKKAPERFEDLPPDLDIKEVGSVEEVLAHYFFTKEEMKPVQDVDPLLNITPPNSEIRYLVKWEGWSHYHNTWSTADELKGSKGIKKLTVYKKQIQQELNLLNLGSEEDKENYLVRKSNYLTKLNNYADPEKIISSKVIVMPVSLSADYLGTPEKLYLIKWKNLPYSSCTWEPQDVIDNFPELLQKYNDKKTIKFRNYSIPGVQKSDLALYTPVSSMPDLGDSDYRVEAVNNLLERWYEGKSSLLLFEDGLERELISVLLIGSMYHFNEVEGPFLIVTTTDKMKMWERLLSAHLPEMAFVNYSGDSDSRRVILIHEFFALKNGQDIPLFNILLTDTSTFVRDKYYLSHIGWNLCIIDEVPALHNRESMFSKCVSGYRVATKLILSSLSYYDSDIIGLLQVIKPHFKFDNNENLEKSIAENSIRKTRYDIENHHLKAERVFKVPMLEKQIRKVKHSLCSRFNDLNWGDTKTLQNIVDQIIKTCSTAFTINDEDFQINEALEGSPKLLLLSKMLDTVLKGKKVLVVSKYIDVLRITGKVFEMKELPYAAAYGYQAEDAIQETPTSNVIISSYALDLNLDLSHIDAVILLDPYSNIDSLKNSKIANGKDVTFYRMISSDSTESNVFNFIRSFPRKTSYLHDYGTYSYELATPLILNKTTLTWILQKTAIRLFQETGDTDVAFEFDLDELLIQADDNAKQTNEDTLSLKQKNLNTKEIQFWNKIIPTSIIHSSVIKTEVKSSPQNFSPIINVAPEAQSIPDNEKKRKREDAMMIDIAKDQQTNSAEITENDLDLSDTRPTKKQKLE